MGYYHFKREDAFDIAHFLHIQATPRGNELVFKICPYCKGEHKSNEEKFAINLNTGLYNCLRSSCGARGTFFQLARDFNYPLGNDVEDYYGTGQKQYKTYVIKHIEIRDEAVKYCASRGISEEICRKYEITVQKDKPNILVLPFRDRHDTVCCIKYRKTDFDKEKDKSKEWFEKEGKPILFGMNHCDMSVDTLVLTEGQMDALALATAGVKNPVSVPNGAKGRTWIPHCWDFVRNFKNLVVFGDNEKGHITLVDMVQDRFPNVTIKVVRQEDYCGCKDANDILRTYGAEQCRKAVENAKPIPISQLVDYTDIEQVNIFDMESMPTHITELDKVLGKGIFFGQVVLLTGQRGDGKSTFMQQLICNAIDSDIKTFLYSGEMPNFVVRNFTDTMLSGMHESELRPNTIAAINKYYEGRLFLYDFNVIEDNEQVDLLRIAEQAITQYGCRLICLDNLMTLVSSANNDGLYQAQKDFVKRLVKIAIHYNVIVILVAHPRKRGGADVKEFTNDDIAGSGDIANMAHVVLSYQRRHRKYDDEDDSFREVWVSKNRYVGKLAMGDNAIPVKYEGSTRRITGKEQSFNWKCRWAHNNQTVQRDLDFTRVEERNEELPFEGV